MEGPPGRLPCLCSLGQPGCAGRCITWATDSWLCLEVSDEIHSAIPAAVRLRPRAGSIQPHHDGGYERRHRRPELRRDVPGVHGSRHVPGPVPAAGVAMTDIITITDMARLPKNTKFIDHGVFLGMTLEDAIKKYKEMYGEEPPAVYHVTRIYIPANGKKEV